MQNPISRLREGKWKDMAKVGKFERVWVVLMVVGWSVAVAAESKTTAPSKQTETSSQRLAKSSISVFDLDATWTNQNGTDVSFKTMVGDVRLVAIIYTSCEYACPLIVADMKDVRAKLPKKISK